MASTQPGLKSRGRPIVTSAAVGVPAMAAMSLKHRPSALWPIFSGGVAGREMDALDHRVRLEQQQPVRHADIQHRAIVARAHDHGGIGRQRARQAADQLKLVHRAGRFAQCQCCWMSRRPKFSALNSAWAVMGASRLFVRS